MWSTPPIGDFFSAAEMLLLISVAVSKTTNANIFFILLACYILIVVYMNWTERKSIRTLRQVTGFSCCG